MRSHLKSEAEQPVDILVGPSHTATGGWWHRNEEHGCGNGLQCAVRVSMSKRSVEYHKVVERAQPADHCKPLESESCGVTEVYYCGLLQDVGQLGSEVEHMSTDGAHRAMCGDFRARHRR